jgi:hypothetical protein
LGCQPPVELSSQAADILPGQFQLADAWQCPHQRDETETVPTKKRADQAINGNRRAILGPVIFIAQEPEMADFVKVYSL